MKAQCDSSDLLPRIPVQVGNPRITASFHSDAEVPPLMHGNDWHNQNVRGWWCSEKYNGWRTFWTGTKLISRQGNDYHAPDWFTAALPKFPLDCELWLGRGKTCDDVHRAVAANRWQDLCLAVFDVPGTIAETGIDILRSLKSNGNLAVATHWVVESAEDARSYMEDIVKQGGEGVMLRRPGSLYRNTRTDDLLKLKP